MRCWVCNAVNGCLPTPLGVSHDHAASHDHTVRLATLLHMDHSCSVSMTRDDVRDYVLCDIRHVHYGIQCQK